MIRPLSMNESTVMYFISNTGAAPAELSIAILI